MRWLTFSTSSVEMIGFFNDEVIPILIEYNHEQSIMRLVRAYNDLLILIPRTLHAYAPNDSSSDEDGNDGDDNDHEDIVSLGRSSSIGQSASSIYSNIFSNASRLNFWFFSLLITSENYSTNEYGNMRKNLQQSQMPTDSRPLKLRQKSHRCFYLTLLEFNLHHMRCYHWETQRNKVYRNF